MNGSRFHRVASVVIGVLWIAQGLLLSLEETIRVFVRSEEGVPYLAALGLYALVVVVGVFALLRWPGWRIVLAVAALYQGFTHFVYLSNVWPAFDLNLAFAGLVVVLAATSLAFVGLSLLHWRAGAPRSEPGRAPNAP